MAQTFLKALSTLGCLRERVSVHAQSDSNVRLTLVYSKEIARAVDSRQIENGEGAAQSHGDSIVIVGATVIQAVSEVAST